MPLRWRFCLLGCSDSINLGCPWGVTREADMHLTHRKLLASILASLVLALSSAASGQTCPNNVPHVTGTWDVLPYQMPINPIQTTLLPSGKVLIVAGSENDAKNNQVGADSYRAAVWDPAG